MLSSGQGRHVSLVFCGCIVLLRPAVVPNAALQTFFCQPGRKLIWCTASLPCFLIHTDLTSNPASFYLGRKRNIESIKQHWRNGCTRSLKRETKGGRLKGMVKKLGVSVHLTGARTISGCQRNMSVTMEPVSFLKQPHRPKLELYIREIISLTVRCLIVPVVGPRIAILWWNSAEKTKTQTRHHITV